MASITPLDIRRKEFNQSPLGYNREQVNSFLEAVAAEMEALIHSQQELEQKVSLLEEKLKAYRRVEQSMNEALVLAKDTAKRELSAAKQEAEAIVQKALSEKEALLFTAKKELAELRSEAALLRGERDRVLLELRRVLQFHLESLERAFPETRPKEPTIDFQEPDKTLEDFQREEGARKTREEEPAEPPEDESGNSV